MSVLRADPSAPDPGHDGRLMLDRLASRHDPVEVVLYDTLDVGSDGDAPREPHRHDYHELIWTRAGTGRHMLDHRTVPVVPGTITVIGRGQVHVFEQAQGLVAAAVRFGDELLHEGPIARADPAWLFAGCGGWNVTVPASQHAALESTIAALAAESAGPLDARSADLQRHLLSVLLLWIERWYDGEHFERRDDDDAALQLYRRFSRVLERDFAAHHDAGHYADALKMPAAALSHALSEVAGRSTKQLVTDRVMLEAARLLRFTDRTVGEIAFATGFGDPLYFSRAFKRHHGEPPTLYRDRTRGVEPA
ncbi:MAG: AraC family transcriptional regulator, transcriptional activator of pobA [bacterium]